MVSHTTRSRRTFLTTSVAALATSVAGCLGDDSDGSGDGDGASVEGELVDSATYEGRRKWEYDLSEGETITVITDPEDAVAGGIYPVERPGESLASIGMGSEEMQYTAEEAATYKVSVNAEDGVSVEIYRSSA